MVAWVITIPASADSRCTVLLADDPVCLTRMSATPVATQYSYEFVRGKLPESARSILEVGCGRGELASRLAQDGLRVLALDADADCVAKANAAGVDARLATWPTAIDGEFDAVLFVRSLHHIHALDPAVEGAVAALTPGGRVIVEDFRAEGGTDRSAAWFTGRVKQLERDGAFSPGSEVEFDPDQGRAERPRTRSAFVACN